MIPANTIHRVRVMNRQINFRCSDVWYQRALSRAQELGLGLSEYIRSTIAKDFEEENKKELVHESKNVIEGGEKWKK